VTGEFPALRALLNAGDLDAVEARPPGSVAACPTEIGVIYLPLEGVVDPTAERQRLDGEIAKVVAEITKVRSKLSSQTFVQNAPEEVVEDHRQRERDWETRRGALESARDALG
jgi:valyl-tRNA synthetase